MSAVGESDPLRVEPPVLHTVEEAAGLLRIGRTLAYAMARRYEETGGCDGLPVVRLGNCLRVPRWALMELACRGRVVPLRDLEVIRPRDEEDPGSVEPAAQAGPPNDSGVGSRPTRTALRLVAVHDVRPQRDRSRRTPRFRSAEQLTLRFPSD